MNFEVFRKCGRGWQCLGEWNAVDSRAAARVVHKRRGFRIIGVRPAYSAAKLFVYRFK